MSHLIKHSLLCLALAFMMSGIAYADDVQTLRQTIDNLKPLKLNYGANNLKANGQKILIVRGAFAAETAWGGDCYNVLVDEGNRWQLARLDERLGNETTIRSVPHTEEDAITSVSFLAPKNRSALYLLVTHREYQESPIDIVPAKFTLYILQRDDDFGIYYLHKLKSEMSKAKYCNSDSAAYHELGIPLPGDGEELSCAKSK